jgi:hypothetical protein
MFGCYEMILHLFGLSQLANAAFLLVCWTVSEELGSETGGGGRNRTGVDGFAIRCITTLLPRRTLSCVKKK